METRMTDPECHVTGNSELQVKIARLEERITASDKALSVALEALRMWQASANEWRSALNDQRTQFVTLDKVLAIAGIAIALATIVFKFI